MVSEVSIYIHGDFDQALLPDFAEWLGGMVFDHQSSELLSPHEARTRWR
jgi:hypothetical protein